MKRFGLLICVILLAALSACGYSQADVDDAYQSGYNEGYETGHSEGRNEGYNGGYKKGIEKGKSDQIREFRQMGLIPDRPANGEVISGKASGKSQITVTASKDEDYVVVLKDKKGKEKLAFYVRAGQTATVKVPAMYLNVYFACGNDWLGYKKGLMFGKDTSYSKDDETVNFKEYTLEYTMYPVTDGNFSETPSNAEEFF